ncbi:MAG: hypothetical protein K2M41_00005 [Muribaculaceae bacterium]|nr:hypothetical protein [Muribaculaceae bacterium]
METVKGITCISYAELTGGIITASNLKAMVRRGKINQTRRGGNGRTALYDIESLPVRLQVEVYRRYGNPYVVSLGEITPNPADVAYYSCIELPNGKKLPHEYVEKYSYGCAVLSRCMELHAAKKVTWEKLAEAVKGLPIKYKIGLPKSAQVLHRKAIAYIKQGPGCLVSLKFGNSNASKSRYGDN